MNQTLRHQELAARPLALARLLLAASGLCSCVHSAVWAQTTPSFDVATIKPADPDAKGQFIQIPGPGRISITNMTVLDVLRFAYSEGIGASLQITGGPNWIGKDHYDMQAQVAGNPSQNDLRLMMRSLLAQRFGMKVHTETKPTDIYALVLAKGDGKLPAKIQVWDGTCSGRPPTEAPGISTKGPATQAPPPPPQSNKTPGCRAFFQPPGMILEGMSMAGVADMLSTPLVGLGRQVVDKTGLPDRYNMTLEFQFAVPRPNGAPVPGEIVPSEGPSIFTALQEQWGMKLEPQKGTQEVLVVDQLARPTEN